MDNDRARQCPSFAVSTTTLWYFASAAEAASKDRELRTSASAKDCVRQQAVNLSLVLLRTKLQLGRASKRCRQIATLCGSLNSGCCRQDANAAWMLAAPATGVEAFLLQYATGLETAVGANGLENIRANTVVADEGDKDDDEDEEEEEDEEEDDDDKEEDKEDEDAGEDEDVEVEEDEKQDDEDEDEEDEDKEEELPASTSNGSPARAENPERNYVTFDTREDVLIG